jgi:hypothetical protein
MRNWILVAVMLAFTVSAHVIAQTKNGSSATCTRR